MTEKRCDVDMATYRKALAELVVHYTDYSDANQKILDKIFSKDEEVVKMFDALAPKIEALGIEINLPLTSV